MIEILYNINNFDIDAINNTNVNDYANNDINRFCVPIVINALENNKTIINIRRNRCFTLVCNCIYILNYWTRKLLIDLLF